MLNLFYTFIVMKYCHFKNLRAVEQMPIITEFKLNMGFLVGV